MVKKKKVRKVKEKAAVQVTGRSIAYIQEVGKNKKPGKPKTVILTTVVVGKKAA